MWLDHLLSKEHSWSGALECRRWNRSDRISRKTYTLFISIPLARWKPSGPIAQLWLERTPDKREVRGSTPLRPTRHKEGVSGDIAQLGERLLCTQEVTGSSPVISTNSSLCWRPETEETLRLRLDEDLLFDNSIERTWKMHLCRVFWSSYKEHTVDALVPASDEGRGKLR